MRSHKLFPWELLYLHLSVAVWGGSSQQSSETWRSMETIPMSSVSSISACCEIKGHSIWEGFCENGIMTQRKRGRKVEGEKKEKRLAALLQAGVSGQHYFTLSIRGHPPQNISCFASHKDPFCPSHHQSPIISALILHEHLCRENTNKGKTRLGHREGWRMMRSQKKKPAFPDQGAWPCDAKRRVLWAYYHRLCERVNRVLLYSYICERREARRRDTCWVRAD